MTITRLPASADAYARYVSMLNKIEPVRQGIYLNRKGYIPLSKITQNQARLSKRIEREGYIDPDKALERINGTANFQDVCVVKKLAELSASVCRIEIPVTFGGTAFGTGFLIAPNIVMTNHHVFPGPDDAKNAILRFRYELSQTLNPEKVISFRLKPDVFFLTSDNNLNSNKPYSGLDFTLVAVEQMSIDGSVTLSNFPFVKLDGGPGKIVEEEKDVSSFNIPRAIIKRLCFAIYVYCYPTSITWYMNQIHYPVLPAAWL